MTSGLFEKLDQIKSNEESRKRNEADADRSMALWIKKNPKFKVGQALKSLEKFKTI